MNFTPNGIDYQYSPSKLYTNHKLTQETYLVSANKAYYAVVQEDGNFVLYVSKHFHYKNSLWSSGTHKQGTPPYYLIMQEDGNLCLYDVKEQCLWSSGTDGLGKNPFCLNILDNGNLTIIDKEGTIIWMTGTER